MSSAALEGISKDGKSKCNGVMVMSSEYSRLCHPGPGLQTNNGCLRHTLEVMGGGTKIK